MIRFTQHLKVMEDMLGSSGIKLSGIKLSGIKLSQVTGMY